MNADRHTSSESAIGGVTVVFYDGVCGLCNRLNAFLIPRDRQRTLRFAPLQGDLARRTLTAHQRDPSDLDTVYVIAEWQTPRERVLERSRAILHTLDQLGGGWKLLARVGAIVPRDARGRRVSRRGAEPLPHVRPVRQLPRAAP